MFSIADDIGRFHNKEKFFNKNLREDLYIENGAVFVITRKTIMEKKSLYGNKHKLVIMPYEESFDIDEPIDWDIVAMLMNKRCNKK